MYHLSSNGTCCESTRCVIHLLDDVRLKKKGERTTCFDITATLLFATGSCVQNGCEWQALDRSIPKATGSPGDSA